MSTTTVSKVGSIINYLKEDEGDNVDYTLSDLDLKDSDGDSAGIVIHTSACNAEGYYEPLCDSTLIIPDDWEGVLSKSNNGWEWLGIDKCEVDADIIRGMVTLDRSLAKNDVDATVAEVCDEVGIAHDYQRKKERQTMTANETIKAYKSATKYKSFRSKGVKYKVQETRGAGWATLFLRGQRDSGNASRQDR